VIMELTNCMKKIFAVLLTAAVTVSMSGIMSMPVMADAQSSPSDGLQSSDIVVLYDNDVHCAADGYAKAAAMKAEVKTKTENVALVSCGDFIQGGALGTLSKGKSIIKIMNSAGYDVVTLGNHEFDYTVPRLKKLTKILKAKVVDCNFRYTKNNKSVYSGYTMRTYGDRKVAFVGITTPESITKSIPSYFQNSRGKYIYTFCSDSTGKMLYSRVQKTVDAARKNGADYVIALGHLGLSGTTSRWTSEAVISHTYGIDAVLDGHSQETYAVNTYTNSRGKAVICSQTGTGFKNVGRLVISDSGHITASLIPTDTYTGSDEAVAAEVKAQTDLYAGTLNKTVCTADELLTIIDPATGKRAVRAAETNLGDFCADALRSVMKTDIALVNAGGIRKDLQAGTVNYGNMLDIFPFGGSACAISATGKQIRDALEMGAAKYPAESGGFLQVSGLKYTIDASVPSSVVVNGSGMFVKVAGAYRVKEIKVYNKKTKQYEALSLTKKYTTAGLLYTLRQNGDGMSMFRGAKPLKREYISDVDVLAYYAENTLKGVIGSGYEDPQGTGRITADGRQQ